MPCVSNYKIIAGENKIGAPKIQNNFGACKIVNFSKNCFRNIGLFSFDLCKVIALDFLFCLIFIYIVIATNVATSRYRGDIIAIRFPLRNNATTINCVAMVERAITIWEEIEKSSILLLL